MGEPEIGKEHTTRFRHIDNILVLGFSGGLQKFIVLFCLVTLCFIFMYQILQNKFKFFNLKNGRHMGHLKDTWHST